MKPRVVELTEKRAKIEILPNLYLRIPRSHIRAINGKTVLFKNPLSNLNCIAHLK